MFVPNSPLRASAYPELIAVIAPHPTQSIVTFWHVCSGRTGMEYLSQIISFIVGALTGGVTVKLYIDRSTSKPSQSRNTVGGDMAGRDIYKR
jgi:hypothetical protein